MGFLRGNSSGSQNAMRMRVIAQGVTVALLVFGSASSGIDFERKMKEKNERLKGFAD